MYKSERGLNRKIIADISAQKQEPEWMLKLRLKALDAFEQFPLPAWGPDLTKFDLQALCCYMNPVEKQQRSWADVPEDIKKVEKYLCQ